MSNVPEIKPRAGIFRFSLRTLLLLTAIVALAVSHFITSMRLRTLSEENRLLRQEVNRFPLQDESVLHVAALQSTDGLTWRWRLHVPENGKFVVRTEYANLPQRGLPTKLGYVGDELPKGDVHVTVTVQKDRDQRWTVVTLIPAPKVKSRFFVPESNSTWIEQRASFGVRQMGMDGIKVIPRGEVAELLRVRQSKIVANGVTVDTNPTDGVMVWIEEQ
jgi:hypothetical protein